MGWLALAGITRVRAVGGPHPVIDSRQGDLLLSSEKAWGVSWEKPTDKK
jgi:hypothetical protein